MDQLVTDSEGFDVEPGMYELWTNISGENDLGNDGPEELLTEFLELAIRRGIIEYVAAQKVSTNSQAVLVVYLVTDTDWQAPGGYAVAATMEEFSGGRR